WMLKGHMDGVELDVSHEHMCRGIGVYFMASFTFALQAIHWPSVEERRVIVESRVICFAGILIFEYCSPILFLDAASWGAGSVFFAIWSAMSALHLLIHPKSSEGVDGPM
ncbi:hypothetical protein PMAYCL1PPCAC_16754, partial [Pristionchus mayeri]